MANDVIFESEKLEKRQRRNRILFPVLALAAVIAIAVIAALTLRGSTGEAHPLGEDTPYPCTWQVGSKGVLTLELDRTNAPDCDWILTSDSEEDPYFESKLKDKSVSSRFKLTPLKTGRTVLVFVLKEREGEQRPLYEWRFLTDTARTQDGSLTASVISSGLSELSSATYAAEEDAFPYMIYDNGAGDLVIQILAEDGAVMKDWNCVSDNEKAVRVTGVIVTAVSTDIYLASGGEPGKAALQASSASGGMNLSADVECLENGSLKLVSCSVSQTEVPEPEAEPEEEYPDEELYLVVEPGKTEETLQMLETTKP
ncbi:MAG: hypothetical protein K5772_08265 [Clostridia bacterium]|nr:hypothetical protein [Clostridia bacterium]